MITFPALFSSNLGGGGSGEPITWTLRDSITTGQEKYEVAYDGSNWLVTGFGDSWYASDPTSGSWTQRSNYPTAYQNWSLCYADSRFLAGSYDINPLYGRIKYASTASGTWTQAYEKQYFTFSSIDYDGFSYYATCGNASSGSPHVYYATTPTGSWTLNSTAFNGISQNRPFSIRYGNGYWVCVGYNYAPTSGKISYRSTNPTSTFTENTSHPHDLSCLDAFYGNGYWVTVGWNGSNGTIAYRSTNPTSTFTTAQFTTNAMRAVYYANDSWVAVGTNAIWTCGSDPSGTWTRRLLLDTGEYFSDVLYGSDGYWVAVGTPGIYTASPGA